MLWKLEVQKMWICFCIQTSQTGLRLSRLWITTCKRKRYRRYRFKRNPCRCQICCQIHLKAMCHCKFLNWSRRLSECHAVGSHGNSLQLLWWFHGFSCMPLSYMSQVFPSEQHHQCCTRHPCQWFCISCPCTRQIGQSEVASAWTSSVKGWKSLDICRFFLRGGRSIPRNHGCACMFGAPVASLPWLEPFVNSERPWREWTGMNGRRLGKLISRRLRQVSDSTDISIERIHSPGEVRSEISFKSCVSRHWRNLQETWTNTDLNAVATLSYFTCVVATVWLLNLGVGGWVRLPIFLSLFVSLHFSPSLAGRVRLSGFLSPFVTSLCLQFFWLRLWRGASQDFSPHPSVSRILSLLVSLFFLDSGWAGMGDLDGFGSYVFVALMACLFSVSLPIAATCLFVSLLD